MKAIQNLFYFGVIGITVYLVGMIFFSSIAYNVNTPNYGVKLLFNLSAPEGWGFFTRSPREEIVDLYTIEKDGLKKVLVHNGHPSNSFGASRKSRRIGMETSIILQKVHDSLWVETSDLEQINTPEDFNVISNENLDFLKDGDYVLVKRKIIPWAWRENVTNKDVPYEIVRIKTESADESAVAEL